MNTDQVVSEALHGLESLMHNSNVSQFAQAVVSLLPQLWTMFRRHEGNVAAMRRALKEADDRLVEERAAVDSALAHKHEVETP